MKKQVTTITASLAAVQRDRTVHAASRTCSYYPAASVGFPPSCIKHTCADLRRHGLIVAEKHHVLINSVLLSFLSTV